MGDAQDEKIIWAAHPSPLALMPGFFATVFISALAFLNLEQITTLVQEILKPFPKLEDAATKLLPVILLAPTAIMCIKVLALRFTRYELTNQRLKICRGILIRRHDEIALQRIRDQVITRPLFGLILDYGSIALTTRDPNLPHLRLGWLPSVREKSAMLRRGMMSWKKEIGYREIETGELS